MCVCVRVLVCVCRNTVGRNQEKWGANRASCEEKRGYLLIGNEAHLLGEELLSRNSVTPTSRLAQRNMPSVPSSVESPIALRGNHLYFTGEETAVWAEQRTPGES